MSWSVKADEKRNLGLPWAWAAMAGARASSDPPAMAERATRFLATA